MSDAQRLIVHFANGTTLAVDAGSAELNVASKGSKAESDIERHFLVSAAEVGTC